MRFEPRAYQPPAIQHIEEVPFCALHADMGLGKTVATLTAVANRIDRLDSHRTLVVAPLRVARMVWAQEAAKWDHLKHLSVQLIRDPNPAVRLQQAKRPAAVHVINYEILAWLVKALDGKWLWDDVIVDEASKIKNMQSWRFKALWHVRPRLASITELTGTPAASGLQNLYGQVFLLDRGERLGRTKGTFLTRWFEKTGIRNDDNSWRPKPGAVEEVSERLRDICFSLRAQDYLDLPPLITHDVEVGLPAKCMEQYRSLERDMWLELEAGAIDAGTAAAVTGKCQQYASGAVYDEEGHAHHVHDAKLEALDDLLSEETEPVVVAYWFKSELARLRHHFPHAEVLTDDPEVERRWNAGEIRVLLAHPASAGHGLNLQGGGRRIVFLGPIWSLELYQQIIERLGPTRQLQAGTPRPVYVTRLVAQGTVDELVIRRLESNASIQDVLRDEMRRIAA